MFENCHKCGQGRLECRDDYASLKSGYWLEWPNETHKQRYIKFTKNLLAELPALDSSQVQYPYPAPTPYKCPKKESCKGGFVRHAGMGMKVHFVQSAAQDFTSSWKPASNVHQRNGWWDSCQASW